MFQMQLLHPWWLLALLALPLTLLLERGSFSAIGPTQRQLALACRWILLILLTLALCGYQTRDPNRKLQLVFLLDISRSIPAAELERGKEYIRLAAENLPERTKDRAEAALLVFGRNASFEQSFAGALEAGTIQSVVDTGNTDIGRALELAAAVFDPAADKRVILLSDGRETISGAEDAARRLRQRGITIDTIPLGGQQGAEVQARGILVPQRAARQERFTIRCVVDSTLQTDAVLKLYRNNVYVTQQNVQLQPGRNVFTFEQTEANRQFYTYSFEIDAPGDTEGSNNRARGFTVVEGEPRLLYITGDRQEQADLAALLAGQEIRMDFHQTGFLPHDLADLMAWDAVFFSDVSAETITPEQQQLIKAYVQALGRGFVMLGGPSSFGVGGWYNSTIEEVLPVTMDFKRQQHFPATALAIVIDRSGSMMEMGGNYSKLDLAKKAAVEAGSALTNRDYIGVITFDTAGYWVTDPKIQKLTNKSRFQAQVGSITVGGGTNIYAGLRPAVDELATIPAQVKHVILLTDGMSAPGDYDGVLRDCARYGITLSTIAVGADADEKFLNRLAEVGQGRFYSLRDARNLPRVLTKETFLAATRSVIEEPFTPNPGEPSPITDGFPWAASRPLLGYNATTKKDLASVTMFTPQGDPLFAHWNFGLGKSMAFTSDARRRWAAPWMGWGPGQALWTQSVRWLVGEQDSKELVASISREGASTTLAVDSFTTGGDLDATGQLTAFVITPSLETKELPLRQVAPGRFELQEFFPDEGNYVVNVVREQDGQMTGVLRTGFAVSYSPEYDSGPPNTFLLTRLSELTLGLYAPEPRQAIRPVEMAAQGAAWKDWTLPLLMAVVLLFPLDIALRRILLPEEGLRAWGEAIAAGFILLLRPAERAAKSAAGAASRAGRQQSATWRKRAEATAGKEPKAVEEPKGPVVIGRQRAASPEELQKRVGSILSGPGGSAEGGEGDDDTYARLLAAKRRARHQQEGGDSPPER